MPYFRVLSGPSLFPVRQEGMLTNRVLLAKRYRDDAWVLASIQLCNFQNSENVVISSKRDVVFVDQNRMHVVPCDSKLKRATEVFLKKHADDFSANTREEVNATTMVYYYQQLLAQQKTMESLKESSEWRVSRLSGRTI